MRSKSASSGPTATKRWVRNTVTPIVDRTGRVRRVAVICEDITQRHNDEERQRLLMAELNHRVRNNLATIQAIARLTARGRFEQSGICGIAAGAGVLHGAGPQPADP